MNNVDENMLSQVLMIALGALIFVLMILTMILVVLKAKEKSRKSEKKKNITDKKISVEKKLNTPEYNKESIYNFMDFDKIEDNMIIQKNGKRYLMVVECQGVNYDLMSKMEKIGVEEGFQQFLNTLRHPIQIYIQTRTVNLDESIAKYKSKVKEVEEKYNQMYFRYNNLKNSDVYNEQELESYWFELTKQRNLLE